MLQGLLDVCNRNTWKISSDNVWSRYVVESELSFNENSALNQGINQIYTVPTSVRSSPLAFEFMLETFLHPKNIANEYLCCLSSVLRRTAMMFLMVCANLVNNALFHIASSPFCLDRYLLCWSLL